MSDPLAPKIDLEALRKEAKRWLKSIRAGDAAAIDRLRRAHPGSSSAPGLRDIQHALARERGFESWRKLKSCALQDGPDTPSLQSAHALHDLLNAAVNGNVTRVAEVLDLHPRIVNERGLLPGHSGMRTALHFAANRPHEAVMRLLLERGADPNIRCEGDWAFPLHFVAEKNRLDLARLLIEHGADPIGAGDYHELEVIGWATAFEYVNPSGELVDYLLSHGARHTLFSAVAMGDASAIRKIVASSPELIERRMDLANQRRKPLHLAVVKRQARALATLLELGADPDALDESGLTALDQAALSGQLSLAQLLFERGAAMTVAAAIVLDRKDDVERLLTKDPDGLKPAHRWGTLIVRASERCNGTVIEALIRYGASVDVSDDPKTSIDSTVGYRPLHAAAFFGNLEAATVLVEHGADVRARDDRYEGTPAAWAAFAGHEQVRDLMLTARIDIFEAIEMNTAHRLAYILDEEPEALEHRFDRYLTGRRATAAASFIDGINREPWYTPLAFAVHGGRSDAVRILLQRGADTVVLTPDGRSLMQHAEENGNTEIRDLLRLHQAKKS